MTSLGRTVHAVGRYVAIVLLVAAVTGCTLTRPAPVKSTFLLEPPLPAAAAKTHPFTLRIGQMGVAAPYRDRSFVYRTGDVNYESDYYHEFFVAPGAMMAQATAKALSSANVFRRVVPSGTAPDEGGFILEGFVTDLYADTRRKPAKGVIGIQFYLIGAGLDASVVWSREYREEQPLREATAESLASAWNEALGRVLAALARDLAAIDLKP